MRYLGAGDVLSMHEREVGDELVDFGLLESAVLRPQTAIGDQDAYPDIGTKAAALFHSLIRNHPFLDGNKRTAVLAVIVFVNLNGFEFDAEPGDVVALALDTAEGIVDVSAIAKSFEEWIHPMDFPDDTDS